jgi:hypothetical protein
MRRISQHFTSFTLWKRYLLDKRLISALYVFYDLQDWSLDDVAQLARWGNLRAQRYLFLKLFPDLRYWLGKYNDNSVKRLPYILKQPLKPMAR